MFAAWDLLFFFRPREGLKICYESSSIHVNDIYHMIPGCISPVHCPIDTGTSCCTMGTKRNWPDTSFDLFGQLFNENFFKRTGITETGAFLKKYLKKFWYLNAAKETVFIDTDGSILTWNDDQSHLQGYKTTEIVGQKLNMFFMPQDRQSKLPEMIIAQALKNGEVVHHGVFVRKDGGKFYGSLDLHAIKSHNTHEVLGYSMNLKRLAA
jgi:PAS domain S-box-containing protein